MLRVTGGHLAGRRGRGPGRGQAAGGGSVRVCRRAHLSILMTFRFRRRWKKMVLCMVLEGPGSAYCIAYPCAQAKLQLRCKCGVGGRHNVHTRLSPQLRDRAGRRRKSDASCPSSFLRFFAPSGAFQRASALLDICCMYLEGREGQSPARLAQSALCAVPMWMRRNHDGRRYRALKCCSSARAHLHRQLAVPSATRPPTKERAGNYRSRIRYRSIQSVNPSGTLNSI